jgi:hypothetical protein
MRKFAHKPADLLDDAPDAIREWHAALVAEYGKGVGHTALCRMAAWLHWQAPIVEPARRAYMVNTFNGIMRTLAPRKAPSKRPAARQRKALGAALVADLL